MLLAGGDLAAQAQKIPYGMVPYGRPVYKNGKTNVVAWRLAGQRPRPIRASVRRAGGC